MESWDEKKIFRERLVAWVSKCLSVSRIIIPLDVWLFSLMAIAMEFQNTVRGGMKSTKNREEIKSQIEFSHHNL